MNVKQAKQRRRELLAAGPVIPRRGYRLNAHTNIMSSGPKRASRAQARAQAIREYA